ncbi:MAG TPA: M13-type metalloendopeptidase, partial [Hyphomonadaceae bacterium]|nr:M13-type metalloendopeptidase [Hyphomonadaceae bacterium]
STNRRFLETTRSLVGQYNAFCPRAGVCVNGYGSLGENIGDLSGLQIAYEAYRATLDGAEAPVIDGLTGDQRFFLSFARTFRAKLRGEMMDMQIRSDHPPNNYRVNGAVRNMDAWYDAFDIKPGDRLYLAPEDRVHVW